MARDWETIFRDWARPPGDSEKNRCDNAVSAIRNAIKRYSKFEDRDISVFAQGSYRNNTNVRQDSDVDIGILCTNTMLNDYPEGMTAKDFGLINATYHFEEFKDDVERTLVGQFGRDAIKRGNKAFDVHETSHHVEADVAPFFEHRRYNRDGSFESGVALLTDKENVKIINWPEQHYSNGVEKNKTTGMRYKSIVRILKKLSNEMADGRVAGGNIPGFLIECLGWNVPNDRFQHQNYSDDVRSALVFLYQHTKTDDMCREWGEVSELKYLFRTFQKWSREEANAFTYAAWNYVGIWS